MNPMTLEELRLRHAQLSHRAETLRQEWRTLPTGNRATTLGKRVTALQARADDYAAILALLETVVVDGTKELRKAS